MSKKDTHALDAATYAAQSSQARLPVSDAVSLLANHGERKHAKIGPSSLKSFEQCPGYMRSKEEGPAHPVTIEGTLIHEALDQGSTKGLTQDQVELYKFAEAYASMLPSAYGEIIKEPRVEVMGGVFGYLDQMQVLGDECDILDWKMGWNKVDPADTNPQGQAYTLGVLKMNPELKAVTVHFVQPRLGYVTSHRYTRDDVAAMEYRIRGIIASVANATPEDYRPCPTNCAYCGRYECPAVAQVAIKVAREYAQGKDTRLAAEAKLRNEPTPPSILADLPKQFYPRAMNDPAEVSKALDIAPIITAWAKSVGARAKEMRVKEGVEIPGWELTHRKGRKSITNGGAAWDAVKDRLTPEDFAAASTPSLGKLKEFYTGSSEKGRKAADGRALESALKDRDALSGGVEEIPYLTRTKK